MENTGSQSTRIARSMFSMVRLLTLTVEDGQFRLGTAPFSHWPDTHRGVMGLMRLRVALPRASLDMVVWGVRYHGSLPTHCLMR